MTEQQSEIQSKIIAQIIENSGKINGMEIKILKQIGKVFNFDVNLEQQALRKKLKIKIGDILLSERQSFLDYLSLKKFSCLSDESKRFLIGTMKNIWQQFQTQLRVNQDQNRQKTISAMLPNLKSMKDYQIYHLNLLDMVRQSASINRNYIPTAYQGYQNTNQIMRGDFNFHNFQNPIYPPEYMMEYPYQHPFIQGSQFYENRQWQSNIPQNKFMNKFPNTNQPISSIYGIPRMQNYKNIYPTVNSMSNNLQRFPPQIDPIYSNQNLNLFKPNLNEIINPTTMRHPYYDSNICSNLHFDYDMENHNSLLNTSKLQISSNTDKQPHSIEENKQQQKFNNCVCKGNKKEDKLQSIKCYKCMKCYHNQCLKINNLKIKKILCPSCMLTIPTLFSNISQTIEQGWIILSQNQTSWKYNPNHNNRIQNLIKTIENKNNDYQIHLRLIKFQLNDNFEKQMANLLKNHHGVHQGITSIHINNEFFIRNSQTTSIQINLAQNEKFNFSRNHSQRIYFYGIYLTQIYSIQHIISSILKNPRSHIGKEYITSFFQKTDKKQSDNQENNRISINLINYYKSQEIIRIPTRGQKCNHTNVFDLRTFLQINQQHIAQIPKCPYCGQECQQLVIDDYIQQKIIIDDNGYSSCTIDLYESGECKYGETKMKNNKE